MAWQAKYQELVAKTHTEQAIWWLNGFWEDGAEKEAENIWKFAHVLVEIETGRPMLYGKRVAEVKQGADVDEMKAHVFLEKLGETLTVRALRKKLNELGIKDNKKMALSDYLLAKYNKTPDALVNSDQGTGVSKAEMDAAQDRLEKLQDQFARTLEALDAQTRAAEDAKRMKQQADAAKKAAEDAHKAAVASKEAADRAAEANKLAAAKAAEKALAARQAEYELRQAEEELKAAVAAVHAEEKKIADKLAGLEKIAKDPASSGMKRAKAENEIAQTKSEDPLPLRKAKITQEAALKRAERARKPFAEATKAAEAEQLLAEKAARDAEAAARKAADDAAAAARRAEEAAQRAQDAADALARAEAAKAELERQVAETERQVKEAEAILAELKSRKGTPHGKIWWMERSIKEAQKYMPKK